MLPNFHWFQMKPFFSQITEAKGWTIFNEDGSYSGRAKKISLGHPFIWAVLRLKMPLVLATLGKCECVLILSDNNSNVFVPCRGTNSDDVYPKLLMSTNWSDLIKALQVFRFFHSWKNYSVFRNFEEIIVYISVSQVIYCDPVEWQD